MVDLIIVMGFLGSGKTTFLENVLNDTSERVGVVVNEFGAVSVDGERLKLGGNIDVLEVNSGSIFCACKADFFIQSLLVLIDQGIEKIYVESSGLSNPSSIEKIMDDLNTLKKSKQDVRVKSIVSIADAERIDKLLLSSVAAISQMERADIILLNKIDIVDDVQKQAAFDAIIKVNAKAKIYPCVKCDIDKEILSKTFDEDKRLECVLPKPVSERSFTIEYDKQISKQKIDAFIDDIIPISVRIKGFLNIDGVKKYIDVVGSHIEITDSDSDMLCQLVVIVYEDKKENAKDVLLDKWQKFIGCKPNRMYE